MYFSEEINDRVPKMLLISCVIFIGMLVIALATITEFKPRTIQEIAMAPPEESEEQIYFESKAKIVDLLKSKDFWNIFFICYCFNFYGYYIIGAFKSIGQS